MEQVETGWRKSSYSGASGSINCVEVGTAAQGVVVRDTANRSGSVLAMPASAWRALLAEVRAS
jgi:Domain of unknown function (DUF397)